MAAFLKSVQGLYLAIYGLSVILIIRYMPDASGVFSILRRTWRRRRRRARRARHCNWRPRLSADMFLSGQGSSKHSEGSKPSQFESMSGEAAFSADRTDGSGKTKTMNELSGLYKATAAR